MATKTLTIDNWETGIVEDLHKMQNGGAADIESLDIYDEPGVLKLGYKVTEMTEAAATNNITTLVNTFAVYDQNASYEMYAGGPSGRMYALDGSAPTSTWTLDNTTTGAVTDMKQFGEYLYYVSSAFISLGQYEGDTDTYTDALGNLSTTNTDKFLEVFAGNLVIGNDRYLDTLEPDHVSFNLAALTLPDGIVIYDMKVWNNYLAILGRFNTAFKTGVRLFLWDGISDYYQEAFDQPHIYKGKLEVMDNNLFLVNREGVFVFNGANFDKLKDFGPLKGTTGNEMNPVRMINYQNKLAFSVEGTSSPTNQNIYIYGRDSVDKNYSLSKLFVPINLTDSTKTVALGGLGQIIDATGSDQNYLLFGVQGGIGTEYGIEIYNERVSASPRATAGTFITTIYDMGSPGVTKLFKRLKLNFKTPLSTLESVTVSYKIDEEASWTSLYTADRFSANNLINIFRYGVNIQLRFVFAGTGDTPEMSSFDLTYEDKAIQSDRTIKL